MSVRSFFYTNVYSEFKKQNYLVALQNAERYQYRETPTHASFRRIYNYLSRVLEDIERGGDMQKYKRVLSRLIIQVQYQKARRALTNELADGIIEALREILGSLDKNPEEAKNFARALRDALDAVLAFGIITKKSREEEEFL